MEEVAYAGKFTYDVLTVDDPVRLKTRDIWQIRVAIRVFPETMNFEVGDEADEIAFVEPASLKESPREAERRIYEYAALGGW
jgi:hypothetical protein